MQPPAGSLSDLVLAEAAALTGVLNAVVNLLSQLPAARQHHERMALGAELETGVAEIREALARDHRLDEQAADAILARVLARAMDLVCTTAVDA